MDVPFVISDADMKAFSALSGDASPIHMNADIARAAGFDGPVVFGALIVAKISKLLGMDLPGPGGVWAGLKIDFKNPLYVDEAAVLHGEIEHCSEATGMVSLKIRVDAGSRRIATASAETVFTP